MSDPSDPIPEYWNDIFPFDPYPDQIRGINESIDSLRSGGIHLLEGPCGTGKTLISLTAGLSLVRDKNTKFERVLVITSKKQQLAAFEDDLKTINGETDCYFSGLSLVGKSDLCPYVQAGEIPAKDIYHKCISLRDNTRQLMVEAVRNKRTEREANAAFGLKITAEREPGLEDTLTFDDKHAPYEPSIPDVGGTEYCPFYAAHITNSVQDEYPLDLGLVTTGEEILEEGSRAGTCPHLEMRRLHDEASVLFGNYKHAYDPTTVAGLTGGIIDDTTLLVCDEAHGLVQEVRDQLSYRISHATLQRAIIDINEVQQWVIGEASPGKCRYAQAIYNGTDLKTTDLNIAAKFLKKFQAITSDQIINSLKEKYGRNWRRACQQDNRSEISIPLQKPSTQEPDSISKWVSKRGYEDIWERFLKVSKVVSVIKDVVAREVEGKSPDGSFPIGNVHELLHRWWVGDHTEYYREITLSPRSTTDSDPPPNRPWRTGYYARLEINNCIPQNEIAGTLDAFGGALLMSATLSPLDIYEEVTGVKKLKHGTQPPGSLVTKAIDETDTSDEDHDEQEKQPEDEAPNLDAIGPLESDTDTPMEERRRKVTRSVFELGFPEENRLTVAVDAPRFTWSNRWPPEENYELRNIYRTAITTVAQTTPGNVLVTMPSYQEASWASEILTANPNVKKEVLTDMSSSDSETEEVKQSFFEGPPKILTTSLRGTLTEGVDFDGDKLHAAIVCGVPITDTSTNLANAIETAYDHRFDGNGFEFAFSVPAIRKTRQALGRVIRGDEDVGVRVLVDERYVRGGGFSSVRQYFPDYVSDEFISIGPDDLAYELESFWQRQ